MANSGVALGTEQAQLAAMFHTDDYAADPGKLADLFDAGRLDATLLQVLLPMVWRNMLDDCPLDVETWRRLFLAAPFTIDSRLVRSRRRRRRLFRGAIGANREGLSWTTNRNIAWYFARHRQAGGQRGQVWTAWVPAQRFLARLSDEDEFVVDARGLPMRSLGTG